MLKNRLLIFFLAVVVMGVTSCGIFGKGCGCPEFGYNSHLKIPAHTSHTLCIRVSFTENALGGIGRV